MTIITVTDTDEHKYNSIIHGDAQLYGKRRRNVPELIYISIYNFQLYKRGMTSKIIYAQTLENFDAVDRIDREND